MIWLAQTTGVGRNLLLAREIRTSTKNSRSMQTYAHAKVAFLRQFGSGLPKTMKILLAARCRSAYFPRMATIPLAHFAICKLQENCKSPPFSETALIFIHLKRCTIEILGRQRHFRLKNAYFPNGDAILLVRFSCAWASFCLAFAIGFQGVLCSCACGGFTQGFSAFICAACWK